MNKIIIKEPQWKGRRVGLDMRKTGMHDCEVEIACRTKNGELWDDNIYLYEAGQDYKYEKMTVKGVRLVMVPIADLKPVAKQSEKGKKNATTTPIQTSLFG